MTQFQKNGGTFAGYRRNHAKGICVSGYFQSTGNATRYSVAEVLAPGARARVIGRFSIPGTNPYAWDSGTPIRGMALQLTQADGEQWRTAMNAAPAFPVATPEGDFEFMQAQQPSPATGDPDPRKLAAFFATHLTANAFRLWDQNAKPSASYATMSYNSLDSFELVDASGRRRAVRWSMMPEAAADSSRVLGDAADYLAADLRRRLARGPLRWRLEIMFANPDDSVDDAAKAWPADHHRIVDAGTLMIRASRRRAGRVATSISTPRSCLGVSSLPTTLYCDFARPSTPNRTAAACVRKQCRHATRQRQPSSSKK